MLVFGVYNEKGKRLKTLKARTVDTIYKNYNAYSKKKGFIILVENSNSFGYFAWANDRGEQLILYREE